MMLERLPDRRGAKLVDFKHAGRSRTVAISRFAGEPPDQVLFAPDWAPV